jgi:hypothetical protein
VTLLTVGIIFKIDAGIGIAVLSTRIL